MDRRDGEPERLKALVEGREGEAKGSSSETQDKNIPIEVGTKASNGPVNSGHKGP